MTEERRSLTPRQKRVVRERFHHTCGCGCGEALEGEVHFDHILPLSLGGSNELDNFAPLKAKHHIAKSAQETTARAKADRIGKKHRGEAKPKSKLRSRGFSEWLGLDGTKRRRKDA